MLVCVVSEETEEKQKLKQTFRYLPENDDVALCNRRLESEMVEDVLYITEQMISKDYGVHCSIKLSEN
jgi:hypothetical protein